MRTLLIAFAIGTLAVSGVVAQSQATTVAGRYSYLCSGALVSARLVDLPAGVILRSGEIKITQKDLDAEIRQSPKELWPQLKRNLFFVLENSATNAVLRYEASTWARQAKNGSDQDEDGGIKAYLASLRSALSVTDDEAKSFYDKNKDAVGDATYDQAKDQEHTILNIQEARFNFLFLPFFKEKKIIIPVIHVDSPQIYVRWQRDSTFNFSHSLFPKQPQDKKSWISVLIYKINISSATCIFKDQRMTPEFSKTIQDLNIGLHLASLSKISFLLEGRFITEEKSFTKISIQGNYNFLSRQLNAKTNLANIKPNEFGAYMAAWPLAVAGGSIPEAKLEIKSRGEVINLTANIRATGIELRKAGLAFQGNLLINGDLTYLAGKKESDYRANIKLEGAQLNGLKYAGKISGISGDIGLKKDRLWTDNLQLKALNSEINLNGELTDFSDPQLKLVFSSAAADLEKVFDIFSHPEGLKLTGISKASFTLSGALNKPPLENKTAFEIINAKLQAPFLKELLANIRGKLEINSDEAKWQELSFDYLGAAYNSEGSIKNFKEPGIKFNIVSDGLNIASDLKIKNNIININTLEAKLAQSEIILNGNADIQDKDNPILNLALESKVNISDILKFLPQKVSDAINKLKIQTTLAVSGSISGPAKKPGDLNLALKTTADSLSIYNLKFNDLAFNLTQKDRVIEIPQLSAKSYSGAINILAVCNLSDASSDYKIKFISSGIDLKQLKMDTGFKDEDISGSLAINADFTGDMTKPETLKGNGSISVAEGKLWQLNFFKGLGEFLFTPDYSNIVFDQALGTFDIENKFIYTEDLTLNSKQLTLTGTGKCGFDGTLNFTVYSRMNTGLIKDSPDLRKFTAAIVGELKNGLATRITGSIEKPKYSVIPIPLELIKTIKNFILGRD